MICLLVTAGPEFTDRAWAFRFLDRLHAERGVTAVLHTPAAEALACEWATARRLPHERAPEDHAGVDVVAALPGAVQGRVYQNRLELLRPDHLVLRRGPGGGSVGVLCIGNVTHAITGSMRDGPAIAVHIVDGGQVKGEWELQPGQDGRWTGVIELGGGRWAAAGLPRDGRLLAHLVIT